MIYPIWEPKRRGTAGAYSVVGFINETGRQVIADHFDEAWPSSEGLAEVCLRKRWGFVNESGDLAIGYKFLTTEPFASGLAAIGLQGGVFSYVDREGSLVATPPGLSSAWSIADGLGLVWVSPNDMTGFVDIRGRIQIEPVFDDGRSFGCGLAPVHDPEGWMIIDKDGALVARLENRIRSIGSFSEGYAHASVADVRAVYVDCAGKTINQTFVQAASFSEGLGAVRFLDGVCGYVNSSFEPVIRGGTKMGSSFHRSRAVIGETSRQGVIDENGLWVVEPRYCSLTSFRTGLALFETEKKIGYIDTSGRVVWEGEWCHLPHWVQRPFC